MFSFTGFLVGAFMAAAMFVMAALPAKADVSHRVAGIEVLSNEDRLLEAKAFSQAPASAGMVTLAVTVRVPRCLPAASVTVEAYASGGATWLSVTSGEVSCRKAGSKTVTVSTEVTPEVAAGITETYGL